MSTPNARQQPKRRPSRQRIKMLAFAHRRVHFIQHPAGRSGRVMRIVPENTKAETP